MEKRPCEVLECTREKICERYEPHLSREGYETKRVATNLICYQAMRAAVTDLYKDELLKEAGIMA